MKRAMLILLPFLLLSCGERPQHATPADSAKVYGYNGRQDNLVVTAQRGRVETPALSQVGVQAIQVSDPTDLPPIHPSDLTTMVIRTGSASIEVDSLERAVAAVQALAARIGAYVAGTEVQTGREQVPSASLELKIPAARFDEALSGLRPIGKVERVDVNAEDVGEEFVDVTARMENSRRLEQRLVTLLAARTGKLSDVLSVERELARVREEIERYEGRLRYLRVHAATSTLVVAVHQPYPVVGTAGTSVVGSAFTQAWRNFVTVMAFLIQSLGVIVPLGALAVLGWFAVRAYGRMGRTGRIAA